VSVEVADDGRGTIPAASVGTERGLVGLRERAALFGGTLEAGPRAELGGRGWRLLLTLPGTGPVDGAAGADAGGGADAVGAAVHDAGGAVGDGGSPGSPEEQEETP